jgi:UDP-2,3-diacylglucosamine pyrophosphatase LpxH
MAGSGSIFVISDLHLADGGPRDDFARHQDRGNEFYRFLDYVVGQGGELVINGDLFEFWQVGLSQVLMSRQALLERLYAMKPIYVVGNHDVDLAAFILDTGIDTTFLAHPFFKRMRRSLDREINDKKFHFMHGHEVDLFNHGDVPGLGRIYTIFDGMSEDLSVLLSDEKAQEKFEKFVNEEEVPGKFSKARQKMRQWLEERPNRVSDPTSTDPKLQLTPAQNPEFAKCLIPKYKKHKEDNKYDVAIVGHTHQPGHRDKWYFNSGSWATDTNSFLQIDASGKVEVFDWIDGRAVRNESEL